MVEIIIVMVVIAILMTIVVTGGRRMRAHAANERTRDHMEQVAIAVTRARDERRQPLAQIIRGGSQAACSSAAVVAPVASQRGACKAAWDATATALAPWLSGVEGAKLALTDGSGRPIVIRIGEAGCAGNDVIMAASPEGLWGPAERRLAIDTSRYSC